jgi:hypothetical protein
MDDDDADSRANRWRTEKSHNNTSQQPLDAAYGMGDSSNPHIGFYKPTGYARGTPCCWGGKRGAWQRGLAGIWQEHPPQSTTANAG